MNKEEKTVLIGRLPPEKKKKRRRSNVRHVRHVRLLWWTVVRIAWNIKKRIHNVCMLVSTIKIFIRMAVARTLFVFSAETPMEKGCLIDRLIKYE